MQLKNNPGKGVRFKDITNQRFGKLVALEPFKKPWSVKYFWKCKCDCGRESEVLSSNLVKGNTTSCGCYGRYILGSKTKQHGMSKTRIFKIWAGVRKRCNNSNMKSYDDYGGRGIKVCEEWDSFVCFYNDMAEGYSDELTLERNDPNGDYCKYNCRWANMKEQARNKRNSVFIELDGFKRTAAEWGEIMNMGSSTIIWRIKNGWDVRRAIYGDPCVSLNEISQYLVF